MGLVKLVTQITLGSTRNVNLNNERLTQDRHLNKLCRIRVNNALLQDTKIDVFFFLFCFFHEESLKEFLRYTGMAAILDSGPEPFE